MVVTTVRFLHVLTLALLWSLLEVFLGQNALGSKGSVSPLPGQVLTFLTFAVRQL